MVALVPGRECGECNACCSYFEILPELNKPSGKLCQHWKAGCGIYESRPGVCRDFFCFWLQDAALGDEWRPDRSGFILQETVSDIPAHFSIRKGLVFRLYGPDSAIDGEIFIETVCAQVEKRVPVFLSVLGPGNAGTRTILLTDDLTGPVLSRRRERIAAVLHTALATIRSG